MMVHNLPEENNYPKAVLISIGLMGAFILLSFFWYISKAMPPEEVGTGGIIVNYGTADEGSGSDYMNVQDPSQDPNANNKNPDKVVPNTDIKQNTVPENSNKDIVTQNVEDAASITKSEKKSTAPPIAKPDKKEDKPTVNPNALYKGAKNNSTAMGDGTGTATGNQGDKQGDPLASNYGQGGSGNGGVSLSLTTRKFISYPSIKDDGQTSGRIAVEIHVGKDGIITFARAGVRGTTITDRSLWIKCEEAVKGARLNQLETAPDEQVATVTINFKVN